MARQMSDRQLRKAMRHLGYRRFSPSRLVGYLLGLALRAFVLLAIVGIVASVAHPSQTPGHDKRPASTVTHAPAGVAR